MPHSIRTKENSVPAALGPRGVAVLLLLLLFSLAPNAKAQQFDDFYYSSNGSAVTITRYSGSGGGVMIPGKIGDLPVTSIGDEAFRRRTGLTSITIPGSVTFIGDASFSGCTGLTSVTIPDGVTSIGNDTFTFCTGLTSIIIPESVTSLRHYSFSGCENLQNVIFKGNAPYLGAGTFSLAAPNFTVTTFPGSSGFSFPTWRGYPSIILSPIQQWRITHFQTPGNTGAAADSGDPDGDASVNLDEFTAGTLPTDAADVLRITSAPSC